MEEDCQSDHVQGELNFLVHVMTQGESAWPLHRIVTCRANGDLSACPRRFPHSLSHWLLPLHANQLLALPPLAFLFICPAPHPPTFRHPSWWSSTAPLVLALAPVGNPTPVRPSLLRFPSSQLQPFCSLEFHSTGIVANFLVA